jgi:hypothetical protein
MLILCGGCVRRTIRITSDPPGALVYLNHQEIGRTPVEVGFHHYGEYDVRLVHSDFEPIVTHEKASPPLWDAMPLDLVAEAMPGEPHSQVHWHYILAPKDNARDDVLARARELRERLIAGEAGVAGSGTATPAEPTEAAPSDQPPPEETPAAPGL